MYNFRIDKKKRHLLTDIITIVIAGALCKSENYYDVEDFGLIREGLLRTFLELPNGIPSYNTFNHVFSSMDLVKFEARFSEWGNSILESHPGQIVNLNKKLIGNNKEQRLKSPIHNVSIWANSYYTTLGQVRANDESNETTTIPELLKILLVRDNLVCIEAMNCREDVAKYIVMEQGDYILAIKNKDQQLYQNIEDSFRFLKPADETENIVTGHNYKETYRCSIIDDMIYIDQPEKWKKISSLIKIESERRSDVTEKREKSICYYISSKKAAASFYQQNIPIHWEMENKLHWALNVIFNEDVERKRNKNAAQCFALIDKVAVNILKNNQTKNISIKRKKNFAAWDVQYLRMLLNI